MNTIAKLAISASILLGSALGAYAIAPGQIRWANAQRDTSAITKILISAAALRAPSPAALVTPIAKKLADTPYVAGGIEGSPEMLTIRLDSLDCTTFVETALAAAITAYSGRTSWRDFAQTLLEMRYRGADVNGYGSRLHYFSDWVIENAHRDNLRDVTDRIARADYLVKTLDFMSRNRDKYPAMKSDDTAYQAIKNAEIGYRSHRFPYIKPMNIKSAGWQEGDVAGIVTSLPGLDVTHLGIITLIDGEPHMIHASSAKGKVIIDPLTLTDYLKRNRKAVGGRVIRLND